MKKILFSGVFLFALAFGLVSCGGKSDPDYPDPGSGGGNSGGGTQEIHKLQEPRMTLRIGTIIFSVLFQGR